MLKVGSSEPRLDAERRKLWLEDARVEIALLDWGGDGPLVLLHHANGFCAALWAPVAERLRERFHVVALDARGHGDSSLPPEGTGAAAFAWTTLQADLVTVARRLLAESGRERIALGIGHSFGGTLSLAAAGACSGLYERLLLLDPVILPGRAQAGAVASEGGSRLAELSRRRRHVFASRAEARAWFAERALFSEWSPRALDLYVQEGLRERSDEQVELKCPGAVEAAIFEGSGGFDVFDLAARVEIPVEIQWAMRGSFARPVYEELAALMPHARIADVEAGHLILMEQPEAVAESALRLLV